MNGSYTVQHHHHLSMVYISRLLVNGCVIYAAIPSICVVSIDLVVACPTPLLFHQQPVRAEESEKQAGRTQAAPNEKTWVFFCSRGRICVPACLREQECIGF